MENLFAHSAAVKVYTGEPIVSKPRITVAGVSTRGKLKIGVSRCSPKDQFNKAIGRDLALNRAKKTPLFTITMHRKVPNTLLFSRIAHSIINVIENDPTIVSLQK